MWYISPFQTCKKNSYKIPKVNRTKYRPQNRPLVPSLLHICLVQTLANRIRHRGWGVRGRWEINRLIYVNVRYLVICRLRLRDNLIIVECFLEKESRYSWVLIINTWRLKFAKKKKNVSTWHGLFIAILFFLLDNRQIINLITSIYVTVNFVNLITSVYFTVNSLNLIARVYFTINSVKPV